LARRSSSVPATAQCVDARGDQQDDAGDHPDGALVLVQQAHAVVDHGDHGATDQGVDDPALATEEAGAADDRRADRIQQRGVAAGLRADRVGPAGQHDAGDGGDDRGHDEARQLHPGHVDAGPAGGLGVAADGVHVPAPGGAAQREAEGQQQADHDDQRDRQAPDRLELRVRAALLGQVGHHGDHDHGQRAGPQRPLQERLGRQALRAPALVGQERPAGEDDDDQQTQHPAQPHRQVAVVELDDEVVLQRDGAAAAGHLQQDALQAQERRQGDDERRDAQPGDQQADAVADHRAGDQRGQQRRDQRPPVVGHDQAERAGGDTTGEAGAQVDLTEQEDEHQAHRQHRHTRGLADQVADVEGVGEGVGPQRGEDHDQGDQAEDGRQRADVAAAQPGDVRREDPAQCAGSLLLGVPVLSGLGRGGRAHATPPFVGSCPVVMAVTICSRV
jgi:hypothetical protein